jgi:hypothetical protein
MKAMSKLFRSHAWPRSKPAGQETPAGSGSSPAAPSSRHGGLHGPLKGLTSRLARSLVPHRSSSLDIPRPRADDEGKGLRTRRVSSAPATPATAYPYDPDGVLPELDGKPLSARPLPEIQLSMPDTEALKPEPRRAMDATLLRPGMHRRPLPPPGGPTPVEVAPAKAKPVETMLPPDGLIPVETAQVDSAARAVALREGSGLELASDLLPQIPASLQAGVSSSEAQPASPESPLQMPAMPDSPPLRMPAMPEMREATPRRTAREPVGRHDSSPLQQATHDRFWSPPPPPLPDKIPFPAPKIPLEPPEPPIDTEAPVVKAAVVPPPLPERTAVARSHSVPPVLPASTGPQGPTPVHSHSLDAVPPAWRQTFQSILDRADADDGVAPPVEKPVAFGFTRIAANPQARADSPRHPTQQADPVEPQGRSAVPVREPAANPPPSLLAFPNVTPWNPTPKSAKPSSNQTQDQWALKALTAQASVLVRQITGNPLLLEMLGLQPPPPCRTLYPDGPPPAIAGSHGPGQVDPVG